VGSAQVINETGLNGKVRGIWKIYCEKVSKSGDLLVSAENMGCINGY